MVASICGYSNLIQFRSGFTRVGIHVAYMAPIVAGGTVGVCRMVRGHIGSILAGVAADGMAAGGAATVAAAGITAAGVARTVG